MIFILYLLSAMWFYNDHQLVYIRNKGFSNFCLRVLLYTFMILQRNNFSSYVSIF